MASGRLFGVGFSPPVNLMRGGRSPPQIYSPFPAYPGANSSLVVVGEPQKAIPLDEDSRFIQNVEEIATRSDVVFGFAEVKYKQLTPATPSSNQAGLGLKDAGHDNTLESYSEDMNVEAVVTVSEEALVLYLKSLGLMAKGMQVAARWWAKKDRGQVTGETGAKQPAHTNADASKRMNGVVQWIRTRFNEVLEKSEIVRLKLVENQKRLPDDHPSHPNNISAATASSTGLGTSAEHVVITPGITAEKLMYDRALEMSRSAAINELTGEDLAGCELSYITAIRMLEAVLENDDDVLKGKDSLNSNEDVKEEKDDDAPINGLEAEDRRTVKNRKFLLYHQRDSITDGIPVVTSIRQRLSSLRKKLHIVQKRASAPAIGSPTRASPPITHRPSHPALTGASPK